MNRVRQRVSSLGLLSAICAVSAAACFDPAAHEPRLTEVTPFIVRQSRSTDVTLNGNFYVLTDVNFGSGQTADVNNTFTAAIEDVALEHVTYENATTLQASIPGGVLKAGTHALSVTAPDGQVATLEHAVLVTNR